MFIEGGNKEFLLNAELEFPIFDASGHQRRRVHSTPATSMRRKKTSSISAAKCGSRSRRYRSTTRGFFDPKSLPLGLFWSVGFGFRWFPPIGPLRFEWGIPLTRRPTDDKGPVFEFSIGNAF